MTLARQHSTARALTLILASCLSVAVAGAAPDDANVPVPAPAAIPAPKPAAKAPTPAQNKNWLRNAPAKVAPVASNSSTARMALLGLFLFGLGGAAVYLKRKRRAVPQNVRSEVQLLSSARVGSKAEVVVISVGGRKLLLGVTESEVSRLAWLDGDANDGALDPEVEAQEESAAFVSPVVTTRVQTAAPSYDRSGGARGFRETLLGALGQKAQPARAESAASTIAENTQDVVTRSPRSQAREPIAAPAGAPDMIDIEGQARGLVLRLQKRA